MQALRDRISSKLSDKSKSKDKDKDGSSSLKTSASADGKQTTLSDSHHQGSSSEIASSAASANSQSSEKGIRFFLNFFQSQIESKNRSNMAFCLCI
jgi:hypothetical protein